jgi:NAD(P)-dependent dehydrogenase (short-subunit alcohol dehydrogenase family)
MADPDQLRHRGRRAAILGGTHGIGLAIAEALVREGAEVLVTGRDPEKARAAATALGPEATVVVCDVTSARDRAALAEHPAARDLDALFVNAGIGVDRPLADVTEDFWDRQFDVNAKGAFFAAQGLVPHVRPGGGIVFTTLMQSVALPGGGVYAATKSALRSLAQALAAELVTEGIRVNTVAPGYIDTPTFGITDATPSERDDLRAAGRAATPMQRLGTPTEVAAAAIFLALEATFTTGTELHVDGGLSSIAAPGA